MAPIILPPWQMLCCRLGRKSISRTGGSVQRST
ncbi:hypothetical protein GDO81_010592 [Engystomops pustulosus]|uniref:Uncharacterized protein n=1 Tax=Engystomops pustulosus TaxID=76066 RepID=A0AAV7C157_ENGPU|nr:hypothetical protein GDO81_010592 [Engystomops pustulosus]